MPDLRRLNLAGTRITDRAMVSLARCRRLEDLDLFGTRLTRTGIARLAGIAGLRRVRLGNIDTELVLAGLPPLAGLEVLEMGYEMNLDPDDLKDRARCSRLMGCLRGLPRLRELKIDGYFDDVTLAEVAKLEGLEVLDLQLASVTDAGLRHVAAMPHLRHLDVSFTPVTPPGIAALRAMRPDLDIKFKF